ncbi:MAG: hypothetical protein ACYCYM_11475 [Saccharofermentanales bacterium]
MSKTKGAKLIGTCNNHNISQGFESIDKQIVDDHTTRNIIKTNNVVLTVTSSFSGNHHYKDLLYNIAARILQDQFKP